MWVIVESGTSVPDASDPKEPTRLRNRISRTIDANNRKVESRSRARNLAIGASMSAALDTHSRPREWVSWPPLRRGFDICLSYFFFLLLPENLARACFSHAARFLAGFFLHTFNAAASFVFAVAAADGFLVGAGFAVDPGDGVVEPPPVEELPPP